jgi:hypothetical protein
MHRGIAAPTAAPPAIPKRSAGRSSGGSDAAVAANLVTCAIGEETGPSAQNPAANGSILGIVDRARARCQKAHPGTGRPRVQDRHARTGLIEVAQRGFSDCNAVLVAFVWTFMKLAHDRDGRPADSHYLHCLDKAGSATGHRSPLSPAAGAQAR